MSEKANNFNKGLHRDAPLVEQPDGTYRFALNAVSETREGEESYISNEEGNTSCHDFGVGWTPLGSVYIGDDTTCVFLCQRSTGTPSSLASDLLGFLSK